MYFFIILNRVRIKITHNIVPVDLQSSITGIGLSRCSNVCPILINLGQPIFRNIGAVANNAISAAITVLRRVFYF